MENNYVTSVLLPSAKASSDKYPKEVKLSTLTLGAYKKYSLMDEFTSSKIIKSILEDLIKDKTDPGRLYADDINYLLIWLRINSFEKKYRDYPIDFTCKYCEKVNADVKIDLEDLKTMDLKEEYKEPAVVVLKNKDEIGQKLFSLNDDIAVDEMLEKKRLDESDKEFAAIANTLVTYNGEAFETFDQKLSYIKELRDPEDFSVLAEFLSYFDFGYDFNVEVECKYCKDLKKKIKKEISKEDIKQMDKGLVKIAEKCLGEDGNLDNKLLDKEVPSLQVVGVPFRPELFVPQIKLKRTYRDAIKSKSLSGT